MKASFASSTTAALIGLCLLVAVACAEPGGGGGAENGAADYPQKTIRIMAPADPGGGWDMTSRAMQQVLEDAGVVDVPVEVYNVPAAGGTVGLSQLVSKRAGEEHEIMMMGLVMVGAIIANDAPVTLDETTPLASLTTEWEAIAVPADSPYKTLEDLLADFEANPKSIAWGGGSAGGTDQILVGLMAQELGVEPSGVNYVAFSGGGEALSAILSGDVAAGVSGVAEFVDQVEAGKMRFLAVSSDKPIEGIDAPTLRDSGLDLVVPNWRGVVGPPDLTEAERDAVIAVLEEMRSTPEWERVLERNGWQDFWKPGEEFERYLQEESRRAERILRDLGLGG
jgi:putative tricarboxylic transport membrane protein